LRALALCWWLRRRRVDVIIARRPLGSPGSPRSRHAERGCRCMVMLTWTPTPCAPNFTPAATSAAGTRRHGASSTRWGGGGEGLVTACGKSRCLLGDALQAPKNGAGAGRRGVPGVAAWSGARRSAEAPCGTGMPHRKSSKPCPTCPSRMAHHVQGAARGHPTTTCPPTRARGPAPAQVKYKKDKITAQLAATQRTVNPFGNLKKLTVRPAGGSADRHGAPLCGKGVLGPRGRL
jgi:hypothetical protein